MEQTLALIERSHKGDKDARNILAQQNMGLVYTVARRFNGRGCEMEDLIQIGSIGLRIAPSGKYLYCTTAGSETAGVFKIDPETGMLSKICILPISGKYPKDIAVFPDEKTMVVLNHESNEIRFFTVDYEKGLLYMKGKPIKIDTPNCILISKAGQPD